MRRFHFRLAGLLRLRTQFERSARRELASTMGAVAAVEQRLLVADEGLRQCEQHGSATGPAPMLARALETGLRRHRWRLQNDLRAAQAQLDRARGEWLQRRRDQQALTQLRDRRRADWRLQQQRGEQHEIEELARVTTGLGLGAREERA